MKRYYHYLSIFRGRPSSQETTSEAGVDTTTEADTTVEAEEEDDVVSLVKSYIDSGTCGSVTTGSSCGDSAESYYREFEYGGWWWPTASPTTRRSTTSSLSTRTRGVSGDLHDYYHHHYIIIIIIITL